MHFLYHKCDEYILYENVLKLKKKMVLFATLNSFFSNNTLIL